MKKATLVCSYFENFKVCMCNTLVAHLQGGTIVTLLRNESYYDFNQMYEAIIKTANNNGYEVKSWNEFGAKWYDVMFIEEHKPSFIENFAYPTA